MESRSHHSIANAYSGRVVVSRRHTTPLPVLMRQKEPFQHVQCPCEVFRSLLNRNTSSHGVAGFWMGYVLGLSDCDAARSRRAHVSSTALPFHLP